MEIAPNYERFGPKMFGGRPQSLGFLWLRLQNKTHFRLQFGDWRWSASENSGFCGK